MAPQLPRIRAKPLAGSEPFTGDGRELGFDVGSFWRWSSSDLLSNVTRGVLAEYLVAQALGVAADRVREPWEAFDLTTPEGIPVEVESASYVQSWFQRDDPKISYGVRRTRAWDADGNRQAAESQRQADVYVFGLLACRDPERIDPRDAAQWRFYVLGTAVREAAGGAGRRDAPRASGRHA